MLPQEILNLMGLAQRARKIALGGEAVQEALTRRQAALLLLAEDFSASTQKHWAGKYASVPRVCIGKKSEWGEYWGRKEVGVMAVTDQNLAQGIFKKALRLQMRQRRRALPAAERERASARIRQSLTALPSFQNAQTMHSYVSWQDEVDTHVLIQEALRAGRRVVVPKVQPPGRMLAHYFIEDFSALIPGTFGILEPPAEEAKTAAVAKDAFDLVIVPGVAFDRQGHRLGYGAGYYDRFLSEIHTPKIALAFAAQMVEQVPAAMHDQSVDFVITEDEVIECKTKN